MFRDILRVMKLYFKKYKIYIGVLLFGFALFTTMSSISQLNSLKYEVANYEFEKNIGVEERRNIEDLTDYIKKEERIIALENKRSSYVVNYNEKLSKESLEYLLHRYSVGAYLNEIRVQTSSTFYAPAESSVFSYGEFNKKYEKYLTDEEKNNAEKYNALMRMEPGSKSHLELDRELSKIYPKVLKYNQGKITTFSNENVGKNNVEVKETLYSVDSNAMYYILITLIALLVFGLEYHTNFGKFVASLPFKKERVYYAKLILSLLVLLSAFIVVGIVNVFAVRASVLGEIYSPLTAFVASYKIFYLGIGLIFIGAILSSFCGSIFSIGVMYVPVVSFVGYFLIPYIVFLRIIGKDDILNGVRLDGIDNYIPLLYHFKYTPSKYIVGWLLILAILALLMAKVYKKHNVESEGRFFMFNKIDILGYIVLLIGAVSFGMIVLYEIFNFNKIIVVIASLVILPYILWKIMKVKIRI